GAIDADGRLTATGRAMRNLALPVRLAHMVAEAARDGEADAAAELAVLLTERGLGGTGADLDHRLTGFRRDRSPRAEGARALAGRLGRSRPSPLWGGSAHSAGVGVTTSQNSASASNRSTTLPPPLTPPLKGEGDPSASREASASGSPSSGRNATKSPSPLRGGVRGGGIHAPNLPSATTPPSAGRLLLHAWPDRVAKARGAPGRYVLANGRGAMLDETDALAKSPFLVVADITGKAQNARIVAAAAISEDDIRAVLSNRFERRTETAFDPEKKTVRVREKLSLGAISLAERMLPAPTGADADRAVIDAVRAHGLALLPWDKASDTLRHRLAWLHRGLGAPWPDMSDAALLASLDDWLLPFLSGEASLSRIRPGALQDGLMSLVPHDLQRKVGDLAPTHFHAPTGNNLPIRYEDEWPVLAIRVQELFGLDTHPAIANGSVPLTLELLSPAHRPIQTTRDLPGFWRGSWAEVRADMRGRYPRHVWPEDPRLAAPTARAKPRGT
ncbi:MAG: ATP-dependent helicase C-terminal domain-containing protein, partial [Mesorhizobium sp.]|nr:ATP-dependent helicase C-terminal domain-containing protein [Mesorhizobium sp.]